MCSFKQTSEDEPCSITYPRGYVSQTFTKHTQTHPNLTSQVIFSKWTSISQYMTHFVFTLSYLCFLSFLIFILLQAEKPQFYTHLHKSLSDNLCHQFLHISHLKPCEKSICHLPTDIHVQRTPAATPGHVRLTCNSSCPLTAFIWYKNRDRQSEKPQFVLNTSADSYSCAVKGLEDLLSAEVCEYEPTHGLLWLMEWRHLC